MAKFLSNIGDSLMLRLLVSRTDVDNATISIVLDRPRTLEVVSKASGPRELIVRCRDIEQKATVILHLPFERGSKGAAALIIHDGTESTDA